MQGRRGIGIVAVFFTIVVIAGIAILGYAVYKSVTNIEEAGDKLTKEAENFADLRGGAAELAVPEGEVDKKVPKPKPKPEKETSAAKLKSVNIFDRDGISRFDWYPNQKPTYCSSVLLPRPTTLVIKTTLKSTNDLPIWAEISFLRGDDPNGKIYGTDYIGPIYITTNTNKATYNLDLVSVAKHLKFPNYLKKEITIKMMIKLKDKHNVLDKTPWLVICNITPLG